MYSYKNNMEKFLNVVYIDEMGTNSVKLKNNLLVFDGSIVIQSKPSATVVTGVQQGEVSHVRLNICLEIEIFIEVSKQLSVVHIL